MGNKAFFDPWARDYDRARRQLIPCFDRFYSAVVETLLFEEDAPIRILDLGAGTGLLSAFVLARFPKAHLTLMDESAEMLSIAKNRFGDQKVQVQYLTGDYSTDLPKGPFKAVISALSIHHLEESSKLRVFNAAAKVLEVDGIFVNADMVLGSNLDEEKYFEDSWMNAVRASGITPEDLAAAIERKKADKFSTLDTQLQGLKDAGFDQVRVVFQDKRFAVFCGRLTGC